jgi:hypothetical protein
VFFGLLFDSLSNGSYELLAPFASRCKLFLDLLENLVTLPQALDLRLQIKQLLKLLVFELSDFVQMAFCRLAIGDRSVLLLRSLVFFGRKPIGFDLEFLDSLR